MRKLSFALVGVAGLALVAAAAPALAEVRLDINLGPSRPYYGQPYYGQPYYGYQQRPTYSPYYYQDSPPPTYNTYSYPYAYRYSDPYSRYSYPGYYQR